MFHLRLKYRIFHKIFFISFLLISLGGYSATGFSADQETDLSCFRSNWPSELSRLVPDPSLLRGKLPNGFRYVIKQNKEPADRVAMYLDVQAGSLHENDDQRGLAHFLEHMLFNGSTNFPPGSLVNYFQSLGMSFGGDTNAHTTHTETVYNIMLPSGSDKDLESGFLVMADYARGALLLDKEIDRERGVIMAEKRARDSAEYRTSVAGSDFAFRGTKYPSRMPIGTDETLGKADHSLLKSYYDAWYRPDNMILVVVGDINPKIAAVLVEKYFAKISPAGPKPACPDFGKLAHKGIETFYHYEPELGKTNISLQTLWDLPPENDSLLLKKNELLRLIGSLIMGNRLQRLQEEATVPFSRVNYYAGDIVNRIGYGSLMAQVDAEHWREAVTSLNRILRQAIVYGFQKNEVDQAIKEILAQLDARVLTAGSEDSRNIARRIIDHLNTNRVYQSAEQEKDLYGPLTKEVTLSEVNAAFQMRWGHNSRLVSVTGNVFLGDDAAGEIASVYHNSTKEPITALINDHKKNFPYLEQSLTTNSPQTIHLKDIDAEKLIFPNGLVVNLKKTPFEENTIRVRADFGSGKMAEHLPGISMLLEDVVNGSGTGRLPQSAVDELLAGSSINLSFKVNESNSSWTGTTLAHDFELFGQVLYHVLLDPGMRENVFERIKENYEQMYLRANQEIEGAMPLVVKPFLAQYNKQFGLPPWKDVAQLNFDLLQQWAHPLLKPEDLEISVVGDFDRINVVSVLTKYFSGIKLMPTQVSMPPPVHFPVGKKLETTVNTSVKKSLVVVAWPTDDFWQIHRTRQLHLLASIFSDRLRNIIREKLAASYSTNVSSFGSRVYLGYGYIISQILVEPGSEDEIINEIFKISDQLQREGVSADELLRARGPLVTSLKEAVRTNQYWLNSVLSLSARHPQQLEWPKTIISDFNSISATEINKLIQSYLSKERAAVVKVTPETVKKGFDTTGVDKKSINKILATNFIAR